MKHSIRILSAVCAVLMLTLSFAACTGKGNTTELTFTSPAGVSVPMGADADPIIEALGRWATMNYSDSCGGFQGKDYIYTYSGFRVSTTPDKNGQIICRVELIDDSVRTPEGLYIGMSRADAETAMKGFTAETVGDNLAYTAGSTKLQVSFRDGAIVGIVYVAA